MSRAGRDPELSRLADAILIPPFPGLAAPSWVLAALGGGLGGVTLYGPNIASPRQLGELVGRLRAASAEPVIAIDEEGGDVTRIAHRSGSPYPGNAALGVVDDPSLTEAVYRSLGGELAAVGVNLNLAPSVDVNTAADNPVIGTRSFGAETELVARHAAAAVAGLQSAGVAACAKHFPGHGSTRTDTHDAIATVDAPMELLTRRDLPPFAAAISAGVRAVMPGHLRVPELTGELPASLSAAAQTGLLRGELGFTGVIVSDALEMEAVCRPYGLPEAAVLAVAAGTDLLCFGRDQDHRAYLAVRAALVTAVGERRLPGERLEEAAARVAALRSWSAARRPAAGRAGSNGTGGAGNGRAGAASLPGAATAQLTEPAEPAGLRSASVGLAAARRALLVEGTPGLLVRPVLLEVVPPANIAVGLVPWGLSSWLPPGAVERVSAGTADSGAYPAGDSATVRRVLAQAAGRSLIIVIRDAHRYPAVRELVSAVLAARPDAVVVEMGLPVWRPPAGLYLASYGAARSSSQVVAETLGLAGLAGPAVAGRVLAGPAAARRDRASGLRRRAQSRQASPPG